MKMRVYGLLICISLLLSWIAGCSFAPAEAETATAKPAPLSSATGTATSVPGITGTATPLKVSPTDTLQPTQILLPTPVQVELPSVTMAPQDSINALLELLRTNGNCTGKCLAGIQPDDMTVQEAVDIMAQWGMVRIGENSQGKVFISLIPYSIDEETSVFLGIGTWTKEFETIDRVSIRIQGTSELYLDSDIWSSNQEALKGYSLISILESYGIPSFVGYHFSTNVEEGAPLEGRTITYGLEMHFEQFNLEVLIGAKAYYDGNNLLLCPAEDPHYLGMWINPERSLKELQEFFPVTWRMLTGSDLEIFFNTFTDETNPNACVTTTLEKIRELQSDFR